MNCSYRILKNVNIGASVRKTADNSTVPFDNEPLTGMKIESWSKQGFVLSHPDLPEVPYHQNKRQVWLDFNQLPLNQLNIEMGIIKNPLTFVERLVGRGGTSMVLLRADTFDYLELLEDKKSKDESPKYNYTNLKPGDQVISCLCREGNVMAYLGKFTQVQFEIKYIYNYHVIGDSYKYVVFENAPERLFFAYKQGSTYNITSYAITNKHVVELYLAKDKGKSFDDGDKFKDLEANQKIIMYAAHSSVYQKETKKDALLEYLKTEDISSIGSFSDAALKYNVFKRMCYITSEPKETIVDNAVEFFKSIRPNKIYFKTEKEFKDFYSKQSRY